MATTAVGNSGLPTFFDIMKRLRPDGSIETAMVELMTQQNGLLKDMVWKQGNLPTGERILRRSKLAVPGFRLLNKGALVGKTLTDQVDESVGLMEIESKVDVKMAKMSGDAAAYRLTEDMGLRQGFYNLFEQTMWYGNTETDPEKWMGIMPRFDLTTDPFGGQIVLSEISASGSDQNSLVFIDWGTDTVYGIYPKDDDGGLHSEDLGIGVVQDEDGNEFRAYRTFLDWTCGLSVKDPRHVVRVANIDTSAIVATDTKLIRSIIKGYHQLDRGGRTAAYSNRFVATYLHLQALVNAANGTITVANPTGDPVTMIVGVPLRISDALKKTEDVVA